MKNKLFRKNASVIPTGAPTLRSGQAARNGGIPSFRRFLATLGMTALFCWSATAQNGVTVTGLNVAAGTVTFNVSWKNTGMPDVWSDSVWVFVDYNKAGRMERLPVTNATATAGTVTKIQDNDKGVWVIGNARSAGSFSATVRLFTDIKDIVGACAYASNYPPVAAYTADYNLKFTGTPMYNLVLAHERGGTMTLRSDSMLFRPDGYRLLSFTDATGAPGLLPRNVPPPAAAASQKTWWSDDGAYAMSDIIKLRHSACSNVARLSLSGSTPEYIICDSVFYYNWHCINLIADAMCPAPWHVPSVSDIQSFPDYDALSYLIPVAGMYGSINANGVCGGSGNCVLATSYWDGTYTMRYTVDTNNWAHISPLSARPVRCVITP